MPSPSRRRGASGSPAIRAHSQALFVSPSKQRRDYLLPTEYPAEGPGLRRPGRGTDLRLPLPAPSREDPSSLVGEGGKCEGGAGELPALGAGGRGEEDWLPVGAPRCCVGSYYNAPARLSGERDGPERGEKAQHTNTAPCTIRAKMTDAKLLRNRTGK